MARSARDFSLDFVMTLLDPSGCMLWVLLAGVVHVLFIIGEASFRVLALPAAMIMISGVMVAKLTAAKPPCDPRTVFGVEPARCARSGACGAFADPRRGGRPVGALTSTARGPTVNDALAKLSDETVP